MSVKQISQWRTVGVVLVLALLLVLSFRWMVLSPAGPGEFTVKLFDTLAWGLLSFGLTAAGKSSIEHLAAGGGLRGALRALMTDAKPGDPTTAPPPAPAPPPSGGQP